MSIPPGERSSGLGSRLANGERRSLDGGCDHPPPASPLPPSRECVWHTRGVPMREDCRHFARRTYDDGEVARFCVLDLAPEAPWRCPENCPQYERTVIDPTFVEGSLAPTEVEAEPDEPSEAIADLLDDAERIVDEAEPAVLRDLDSKKGRRRRRWPPWKRTKPDDGDDWHLSNR
jgi:hypothetical protein